MAGLLAKGLHFDPVGTMRSLSLQYGLEGRLEFGQGHAIPIATQCDILPEAAKQRGADIRAQQLHGPARSEPARWPAVHLDGNRSNSFVTAASAFAGSGLSGLMTSVILPCHSALFVFASKASIATSPSVRV